MYGINLLLKFSIRMNHSHKRLTLMIYEKRIFSSISGFSMNKKELVATTRLEP